MMGAMTATMSMAALVAKPHRLMPRSVAMVLKKMGRMVTTITEWALLAQSYIIQLFSSLEYPFKMPTNAHLFF